MALSSTLVLSNYGETDSVNGMAIYRFYSSSYWPLNGKGFGAQGQVDCFTKELQNQGYIGTIHTLPFRSMNVICRSSLVFSIVGFLINNVYSKGILIIFLNLLLHFCVCVVA